MFKNILIILLTLTTIFFAWISLTMSIDPIQRTYQVYNHMTVHEDGSYSGEDLKGVVVEGCIKNALCSD